jgi:hypothetical protein
MRNAFKRNAILVSSLAMFFWWTFGFAKHDAMLRRIIPFGGDPYDSVSSFGVIAASLLALVSFVRAFFRRWVGRSGQPIYILRAQIAIPFCILLTIAAEAVAMARHTSMWLHAPGRGQLLIVLASETGFALIILGLLSKNSMVKSPRMLKRATAIWLGTLLALGVYPERLILGTTGHLVTVVLGAFLLFAPLSALIKAWLPETPRPADFNRARRRSASLYAPLALAAAIGLIVGAIAYAGELSEGGIHPATKQILFIGSIYVGLGASGLLIGYASLGRLLGFVISEPEPQ